ncbi:hypothetical protein H7H48_15770 [Nitratireductor sp. B36]|uniref:hypothetical protein n=1 Tax=Nitratireductor sp. B36 TaxID=2762059 RepID=UPI001E51BB70|nr:hypothetical protein [Nitratireductor sp. B36]MCC5780519.1 hypothetical protein [Nitratireductor sp. B36]
MFYEGDTIYSYGYHFPIATLMADAEGRTVVLFTTDNYSTSTAKHKSITGRACSHMTVFHVPHLGVHGSRFALDVGHHLNVQDYLRRITETLERAKRARSWGPFHLEQADRLIAEAERYITAFSLKGYEDIDWSPESIVAGVKEATRLQAEREEEARRKREEAARRKYREEAWPQIKAWLRGETLPPHKFHSGFSTKRPLPRISHDRVETTWGANVPLEVAKLLYWRSIRCRREHTEYVPERSIHVGDFRLTRIKPNGDLVVGCHDIPFWFMHYAAKKAGIPDKPASIAA